MNGKPEPHEAAALLTNWLALFETSLPQYRISFWTLRSAMFYSTARWANYKVRKEWGKTADFIPWQDFTSHLLKIPEQTGLIFFPGKFRTLPTPGQIESVYLGLSDSKKTNIISALIFEPRENVITLEGDKMVLDDKIRTWAYSLLPVDIITRFPVIQEGENIDQFYSNRYAEIRRSKSGWVGVGVGASSHREKIIIKCQNIGIEVVDASVTNGELDTVMYGDTTDFDKVSVKSDLANELILSFLREMKQI